MSAVAPASDPVARMLRTTAHRTVDALVDCAVDTGSWVGWPSWQVDARGWPMRLRGSDPTLYNGGAGVAWALAEVGVALDRSDAVDLAVRGAAAALGTDHPLQPGLLDGWAGVVMAAHHVHTRTGMEVEGLDEAILPGPDAFAMVDLFGGLAGLGIAQARIGCSRDAARATVAHLHAAAQAGPIGLSWADPSSGRGRPLCGLAHGASGIALAAAELAAGHAGLPGVAAVIDGAVRWEATWFDPVAGGWPDLREDGGGYPLQWCHGAAGVGAARLRLLALAERGVDLGVPVEQVEADAQVAVQACGRQVATWSDAFWSRPDAAAAVGPRGLTLCHGPGGPIDVLLQAYDRWGVRRHLVLARDLVRAIIPTLADDPLEWPSGLPDAESAGLMVGLAGTALLLARLADPDGSVASPALLGG